jgi:copper transport protein
MAMDSYHNLWVAEHTINKIAVIDPRTGASKEVNIPNQSPFVQWITADSKGNIWLAEQRGSSLAVVTSTPRLGQSSNSAGDAAINQVSNGNNNNNLLGFPRLGLSYADVVGPSVAAGIIVSALFYTKSVIDLNNSVKRAKKNIRTQ